MFFFWGGSGHDLPYDMGVGYTYAGVKPLNCTGRLVHYTFHKV